MTGILQQQRRRAWNAGICICMAIPVWSVAQASPAIADVGAEHQEIMSRAMAAWNEYRKFAGSLQGSTSHVMTDTKHRSNETRVIGRVETTHKRLGSHVVVVRYNENPRWNGYDAIGINSKYAFRLTANVKDKWVLSNLAPVSERTYSATSNEAISESEKFLCAHYFVEGVIPIWELVQQPEFEITRIAPTAGQNRGLLRVEFRYSPEKKEAPNLRSGHLILDPEHFWYIVESETFDQYLDGVATSFFKNIVKFDARNRPILVHQDSEAKYGTKDNPRSRKRSLACDFSETTALKETEFTLTAFGLPEPAGVTWEKPRNWLWIILGGVGCGVLALGFAWLRRRKLKIHPTQSLLQG